MQPYSDSDVSADKWRDLYKPVAPIEAPKRPREGVLKEHRLSWLVPFERALQNFSVGERMLLYIFATLLGLSALILVSGVNSLASTVVPSTGGSLTEGQVGPARFINPLLTISTPDEDLTALIYSGLMRALPDGTLVPDLAQGYTISPDGRVYTFKLRPNATFQDGSKVSSADVVFTIQEAQDPSIDSPHRADWTGVSVAAPDERTVVFTLPHAYEPFIQNATLGILPKALWENVSAEEFRFVSANTHPIGSGPYNIDDLQTDATGGALRYDLVPFKAYALGSPYLSHISFVFFKNTDALLHALNAGTIDAAAGLSPENLSKVTRSNIAIAQVPLPRVFGVFFNQSHDAVLADPAVRRALDAAVDKEAIVKTTLAGRGVVLSGPIPPGLLDGHQAATPEPATDITSAPTTSPEVRLQNARAILQKGGWSYGAGATSSRAWTKNKQMLTFTLATADQPELIATAKALVADWQNLGVPVTLQTYPLSDLNTTIIRPRNYDAILFGEVVGPQLDLYAFWHSSQRNDPGLNLAMYANPKADTLLSQARATSNTNTRAGLYKQFASIIATDTPAVFLYSPDYLYVVPKSLSGVELGALSSGADRFENVYQWYTDTENVWTIFAPQSSLPN